MRHLVRVCIAIVLLISMSPVAWAEDPPFAGWTGALPALPVGGYAPSASPLCPDGADACVHAVIDEMTSRFDALGCDHDAIFALAYLRTTEEYHRAEHTAGFFEDPAFVNHEDNVFASYYFKAFDVWHSGDVAGTPLAWRIAFDGARSPDVSALGNMFLGANAHINRDLPYVLWQIGLVKPDGSTRKTDHDKVNEFLNRIMSHLLPEVARRFDPTFDDIDVQGTWADNFALFESMLVWRESAWRNAGRLANARDDAERAIVAESIEQYAAAQATAVSRLTINEPGWTNADRDAYCAAHHDD